VRLASTAERVEWGSEVMDGLAGLAPTRHSDHTFGLLVQSEWDAARGKGREGEARTEQPERLR
jgi:hypothetical protein